MCCLLFRSFWLTCAEGGDNDVHTCRIESTWSVGLLYQRKRVYSSSSASDCLFIRVNIQFTCICRHFIRVSVYPVVLPVSGKTPNCHHGAPSISCHWLGFSCPGQSKDLNFFKRNVSIKKHKYCLQELQPIPALPLSQQRGQGRIVGGEEASDGEFPFQVRV